MDNTWASPLYFRPFEHGVDVSIQAATKYIVGHADAMLGAITSNARAAEHVARAKELLGVCPGSEETYLGMRGLRTLSTRLAQHQRAGARDRALAGRPPRGRARAASRRCRAIRSTRCGSATSSVPAGSSRSC